MKLWTRACHTAMVFVFFNGFPIKGNFKLWADVKTNLPIRIEAGDDQVSLIYERFRWDEALQDEMFQIALPKGYVLEELAPAAVRHGWIYYHQGSNALVFVNPEGADREMQFVPRAPLPATYVSDRSEVSPDGRYLAIGYTRVDKGSYPPDGVRLWDRTQPENPAVEIYHRSEGEMQSWEFSPDGTRLYVVYWEQVPGQTGPPGRYGADVVDLATKRVQPVKLPRFQDANGVDSETYFATASADGSLYLVIGDGLHVATAEGKLVRRLTPPGSKLNPRTVHFSPDGKQVLFSRIEENRSQRLCAVGIEGGAMRELSTAAITEIHPRWSPDGKQIAFTCRLFAANNPPFHHGTETYLKVIAADGSGERTLIAEKVPAEATGLELIGWR